MVQCNVAFWAQKDHHDYNGRGMVLFAAPKKPKERVCWEKDGEYNNNKTA